MRSAVSEESAVSGWDECRDEGGRGLSVTPQRQLLLACQARCHTTNAAAHLGLGVTPGGGCSGYVGLLLCSGLLCLTLSLLDARGCAFSFRFVGKGYFSGRPAAARHPRRGVYRTRLYILYLQNQIAVYKARKRPPKQRGDALSGTVQRPTKVLRPNPVPLHVHEARRRHIAPM